MLKCSTVRLTALFLLLPLLLSCDNVNRLQDQVDDLNKQLESMKRMVDTNWQATIRAVPGERYLQLIDDLNGPDGPKKAAAKRFLISLGNLDEEDLASKWVVSVWAKWDGDGNIRIDAAPAAATKGRVYVEQLVESGFKPAITEGLEALSRPRTEEEIRTALAKRSDALFNALRGRLEFTRGDKVVRRDSLLLPVQSTFECLPGIGPGNMYLTTCNNESFLLGVPVKRGTNKKSALSALYSENQRKFSELLASAILTPIETVPLDKHNLRFEEPWDVLSKRQTLHIVVSEQDWRRVDGVDVTVRLHKKGDVDALHPNSRGYTFRRSEFTRSDHDPVPGGNPELGAYRWAAITLIDLPQLLNREGFAELKEFYKAQEEFEQLQQKAGGV